MEEEKVIDINGRRFTNMRYADGTVILAENEHDLQNMLNNLV